jgi:hypothetical protein
MIRIERNDPTYILGLIGQVVSVSLETVKIVRSLPPLGLPADEEKVGDYCGVETEGKVLGIARPMTG